LREGNLSGRKLREENGILGEEETLGRRRRAGSLRLGHLPKVPRYFTLESEGEMETGIGDGDEGWRKELVVERCKKEGKVGEGKAGGGSREEGSVERERGRGLESTESTLSLVTSDEGKRELNVRKTAGQENLKSVGCRHVRICER
jgi:hypothetical protein